MKKAHQRKAGNPVRPVTLADIGREAGVSFSIVSRVLRNRKDRIPEATREKVIKAAERLGYRRNLLIQGVQTGRSMNIGVMIPSTGSYFANIVRGIHDAFREQEYCILLAWNPEGPSSSESKVEREIIHSLLDRRVDGIILLPTHPGVSDLYFAEVQERHIPLVTVDRPLPGVTCDFSGSDDELGARLAARHLLEKGHRNLVHLAVDSLFAPAVLRRKGFEEECAGHPGVTVKTVTIDTYDSIDVCRRAVEEILTAEPAPTGFFLAGDGLAGGVFQAVRKLGLRIPQDVSVVGFGNLDMDEWTDPPLTSVDQKPYEMGQQAARMILSRIEGRQGKVVRHLVEPALIARASVADRRDA